MVNARWMPVFFVIAFCPSISFAIDVPALAQRADLVISGRVSKTDYAGPTEPGSIQEEHFSLSVDGVLKGEKPSGPDITAILKGLKVNDRTLSATGGIPENEYAIFFLHKEPDGYNVIKNEDTFPHSWVEIVPHAQFKLSSNTLERIAQGIMQTIETPASVLMAPQTGLPYVTFGPPVPIPDELKAHAVKQNAIGALCTLPLSASRPYLNKLRKAPNHKILGLSCYLQNADKTEMQRLLPDFDHAIPSRLTNPTQSYDDALGFMRWALYVRNRNCNALPASYKPFLQKLRPSALFQADADNAMQLIKGANVQRKENKCYFASDTPDPHPVPPPPITQILPPH